MGLGLTLLGRSLSLVALISLGAAAPAAAVQPGPNGKIAFASGRDDGLAAPFTDATAQLWIVAKPGGAPGRVTLNAAIQHRHPSWSPDRTKIAYSAGAAGDYDIYVLDLTKPASGTNPRDITQNPGIADDRPSWSPDGTKIAYTAKPLPSGDKNIYVQNAAGPQITQITNTVALKDADKPAWSPDSRSLFYSLDVDPAATINNDIYRVPIAGGPQLGTPLITGVTDDYQPAVSPDGQDLCFIRGAFGTVAATVQRSAATGGVVTPIAASGNGDYNCVWSPDGTKIAYVTGIFGNGALVMKSSDGSGVAAPVVNDAAGRFDGNPDWAPNPSPTCQDGAVRTASGSAASIPLGCTDPAPENDPTTKRIVARPAHGTLGPVAAGNPARVTYTPARGFSGADAFTFRGNDGTSDSNVATVKVTVAAKVRARDRRAPAIAGFRASPGRWRLGSLLPRFSRAPVGTTIAFRLSERATVTLSFATASAGRRVGRRCVAPTRANRRRARCTRYVGKGSLRRRAKAGFNRVRFQGPITRTRRLGLGRHRVTIRAVDAARNRSRTRTAFFAIVRR